MSDILKYPGTGGGGGGSIGAAITGGTPGSVLFIDGSGNLGQDNANFFWDDTNNRLGLGLTSPAVRFHQDGGNATATYHKFTAGTTTGTTSTDGFDVGITSAGVAELRQRENNYISVLTNNTEFARFTANQRLIIGSPTEAYPFFATDDQKLTINSEMTSVSNLINILSVSSLDLSPSANTNTGTFGFCIYAAQGFTMDALGSNDYNGGLPVIGLPGDGSLGVFSAFGAFGQVNIATTTGSDADGFAGVGCITGHQGGGGNLTLSVGGSFACESSDDLNPGAPAGSITNGWGGYFTCKIGGVNVTNAVAGFFNEPFTENYAGGGGSASITNRTAIYVRGTMSILEATVASASSITGMPLNASVIYLTGSTATTIHGIDTESVHTGAGKMIWIINQTGAALTFAHDSGTEGTAANRIYTPTGANMATTGNGNANLYWSTTANRWILLSLEA